MATVIIVNYNTRDLTTACLQSLQQFEPRHDVIVVDNASSDDSAVMLRRDFPHVQLIQCEKNVGFGCANNQGWQRADDEIVVLLNSDTVLTDDALSRCIRVLEEDSQLGAVSPRLVGVDGIPQDCRHSFPTLLNRARQAIRLNARPPGSIQQGSWLAGTCLVLRREAVREAGGLFDENLFMYWEDTDLSSRLLRAGWQLGVVDHAQITHHGGASGGGDDAIRRPDLDAWYTFGRHYWFAKHRPRWQTIVLWLMDFADIVRCLIRGTVHAGRRAERVRAGTMFRVLMYRLLGLYPRSL